MMMIIDDTNDNENTMICAEVSFGGSNFSDKSIIIREYAIAWGYRYVDWGRRRIE